MLTWTIKFTYSCLATGLSYSTSPIPANMDDACIMYRVNLFSMAHSRVHSRVFKPTPFNPCMVNQEVNGSQCTIVWHMNN
jgi:hypothetical protein